MLRPPQAAVAFGRRDVPRRPSRRRPRLSDLPAERADCHSFGRVDHRGVAAYLSVRIPRWTRVKPETALAIVLTTFFGLGTVFLTLVAKTQSGGQSGLDSFLFGQAASLVGRDVQVMGAVALFLVFAIFVPFPAWKLWAFDPLYARTLGYPVRAMDFAFTFLLTLAVAVGLEAVGVVLMSALLITPPLTARLLVDRLEAMVLLAGGIGGLSGVVGTLLSTLYPRFPTGPLVVLTASAWFVLAWFFAPKRGLVSRALRRRYAFAAQPDKTGGFVS
ncbi:metal ABC transporter permease [Brockia lithotrophica]|uniref:metal ABC transporter permease n=1 Tax=Brockia lithotrophica TaxID=933949 RepID=UPI00336BBDB5